MKSIFNRAGTPALLVLLMALAAGAAVDCPQRPWLKQERRPDGSLLVTLVPEQVTGRDSFTLLLDHESNALAVHDATGRSVSSSMRILERGRDRIRSGLRVTNEQLTAGLLISEQGGSLRQDSPLMSTLPAWAPGAFLRLQVGETGMVRVDGAWLREQLPDVVLPDPRRWSLIHEGHAVPLYLNGDGDGSFDAMDYLEFWSEPTRPNVPELGPDSWFDPWTAHEIYFLSDTGQPGIRFAQESGEVVETDPDRYRQALTFPERLHLEQDINFSRLTYVLDEPHPDHVYWTGGIYGGELQTIPFELPGLYSVSSLPVSVRACFRGLSAPAEEDDAPIHQRLRLYFNSTGGGALEVGGDGSWINQQLRIVDFGAEAFPDHQAFLDGPNELFIAGVDEAPAGPFSAAMLNWIEVGYQRRFRAEGGLLVFGADPAFSGQIVDFTLTGFGDERITLYKLGSSRMRNTIIREVGGEFRLRFQDEYEAGSRYVALVEGARILPGSVQRVQPRDVSQPATGGADALVIVADSLYQSGAEELLGPALDLVRREGGQILVMSDREVYDRFSFGKTRPHAFRDLIRHAWNSWAIPPRWVVLVGDGALIPRLLEPGRQPVIPLLYEQVYKWGAASSDDWFTRSAEGGDLPVLLSRWPAATPEELINLSEKVVSYAALGSQPWMNSILLTSGASARDTGIFQQLTEDLVRFSLPDRFFLRRIEAGETAQRYGGGRSELLELVDQGQLLVNYAGHGGGAVWEDNGLFQSSDVASLNNADRLAFFTNATCFIGSLDYDGALGRALLNTGPMGAIGVLGSTGLGFRDTGMELITLFYEYLCADPDLAVGEALRLAKQSLALRYEDNTGLHRLYMEAVNTMTVVLGLPWQRLHVPREGAAPLVDPALVQAGGQAVLRGVDAAAGTAGVVELYSSTEHPVQSSADYVNDVVRYSYTAEQDGSWELPVDVPSEVWGGGAILSARSWNGGEAASSSTTWLYYADSLAGDYLWRAALLPSPARPGDLLGAELRVAPGDPIDSLLARLRVWPAGGDSLELGPRMYPQQQDTQLWSTPRELGPFPDSTRIRMHFDLYRNGAATSTTASWFEVLAARPVVMPALVDQGGEQAGYAVIQLVNLGEASAEDLRLLLVSLDGDTLHMHGASRIDPGASVRAVVPLRGARLDQELRLRAVAGGVSRDTLFMPGQVLVDQPSSVAVDEGLLCALTTPDSLAAVAIGRLELESGLQPDLELLSGSWTLQWIDPENPSTLSAEIFEPPTEELRALVLDGASGLVLPLIDGSLLPLPEQDRVRLDIGSGDGFMLGRFTDSEAPRVELEVDGQVFADGGYVPEHAAFSWLLSDRNGIDPRPERLELLLDGAPLDAADYSLLRFPDQGDLGLRLQIQGLVDDSPGLHEVELRCRDAAGNAAEGLWRFRVGSRLGLEHIGTYPNPFERDTRFIFSLTGVAESVRVDIFTVAGRRIRTLHMDGPLINYVELPWDGRDRSGDVVANGVYFYLFTAKGETGTVEHQGKVARLK